MDIELLKLLLDFAVIPAAIFAYKIMTEITSLKSGLSGMREQNSKEHNEVVKTIKELHVELRDSERRNQSEHKELGAKLSDFERENEVQHTILNNGKRLT